jgi:hypothetical protein
VSELAQPHSVQGPHRRDGRLASSDPIELERHRHVFHGGQSIDQVVLLEDVPDSATPHLCELSDAHAIKRGSLNEHLAGCRAIEPAG